MILLSLDKKLTKASNYENCAVLKGGIRVDATFQRYVALTKVVQYSSFSRAAEALQYSQPAISRMIKGLEDDFGVPLLERSSKGVFLTSDSCI